MSDVVIRGRIAMTHTTDMARVHRESIDTWLERITRLTNAELENLCPLLCADDAADTQRKLISLCTILANPERALANWLDKPVGELLERVYQLHTMATYLKARERGQALEVVTFKRWCSRTLAELLLADVDNVPQIVQWCSAVTPAHRTDTQSGCNGEGPQAANAHGVPDEIAEEETSPIEQHWNRKPGAVEPAPPISILV